MHRDVKPANIWLEEGRDRVKIVDFGLALANEDSDARLTEMNYMVGTPMYMSPEQADAAPDVDARCDLFSLGSVLYRMSTGELPFKGKTTMAVLNELATKTPVPPREINHDLPPALSDLIVQLLQKDRERRPRSARIVVATLAEIREAPGSFEEVEEDSEIVEDVAIESSPEPPRPKPRRRPTKRERDQPDEQAALEWRVIKLAIFAGVIVVLLLAALVIKNRFFAKKAETGHLHHRERVVASRSILWPIRDGDHFLPGFFKRTS